jgi:hypothetical protein
MAKDAKSTTALKDHTAALVAHTAALNAHVTAMKALTSSNKALTAALTAKAAQKTPTYPYAKAESIVLKAFNSLGKPTVKDTDTLTGLNLKTTTDLLGLLDAVNEQIPDDSHLLPVGAISSWKKTVGDVVTSVQYAPTNPPPKAG